MCFCNPFKGVIEVLFGGNVTRDIGSEKKSSRFMRNGITFCILLGFSTC